jgi:drug/metabolite transporter (DMT)-like permease
MVNQRTGLILVFSTAVISGFSVFINQFGVAEFNPYLFTFLKNTLVAVFLFALILGFREIKQIKKLTKKDWLLLLTIGLFGGAIPFLLFFKGLSLTSAANGSFIQKTIFVYVAFFAAAILREKISFKLYFLGAVLLLGNLLLLKALPSSLHTGDYLILAATAFWAFEYTISKHALKTVSPKIVALGRMGIGSLFILIFLVFTGNISSVVQLSMAQIPWILITSALLLGYVLTWYSGLKSIKVTTATVILLLGSPITTALTLFSGKVVTANQFAGLAIVATGMIVALGLNKFNSAQRKLNVRS